MPVRDKAYRSYMSIGAESIALFKQFAMDSLTGGNGNVCYEADNSND